jgi:hypothetical protein
MAVAVWLGERVDLKSPLSLSAPVGAAGPFAAAFSLAGAFLAAGFSARDFLGLNRVAMAHPLSAMRKQ